jgi:CheY-like chemotaxis protein
MTPSLATHLVLLAQDDTGAATRWSIVLGALAFPCLVIIAVIWHRLKDAKESEKHIEKLQERVVELEQEREQEKWDDTATSLTETTISQQPGIKSLALEGAARPYNIVHIDDEEHIFDMVGMTIRNNKALKNVNITSFLNRDEAWQYLLHTDPDLLITDLRSDNVPGRTEKFGMSGLAMLALLTVYKVNYPILVFSGSLLIEGYENKVRECAGRNLNVSLLKKPATPEELNVEVSRLLLNKEDGNVSE